MRRPVIGLSGTRHQGSDIVGNLEVLANSDIDVYYADYARAVLAAGGLPTYVPVDLDPADAADNLDGLLLTGGADIEPARYGGPVQSDDYPSVPIRDDYEFRLYAAAVDRALPTLGVCRGLQLINVAAGGTLLQHVPTHAGLDASPTREHHDVVTEAGSRLAGIYGERRGVNSLHHQAVDRLGADLRVTGRAEDGGVEGIEHVELPIVAVQWHPEMMPTASTDPIFAWLVRQAGDRRLVTAR